MEAHLWQNLCTIFYFLHSWKPLFIPFLNFSVNYFFGSFNTLAPFKENAFWILNIIYILSSFGVTGSKENKKAFIFHSFHAFIQFNKLYFEVFSILIYEYLTFLRMTLEAKSFLEARKIGKIYLHSHFSFTVSYKPFKLA